MGVIALGAGTEWCPVRYEVNIRHRCRAGGEGDKRPLGVQEHVVQQIRPGPAKAAGRPRQVLLVQPFQVHSHSLVRNRHGTLGMVGVKR